MWGKGKAAKVPSQTSITPSVLEAEEADTTATQSKKWTFESELQSDLKNPKKFSFEEEFLSGNNNNNIEDEAEVAPDGTKKKYVGGEYESSKKGIKSADDARKAMAHLSFEERNQLFAENVDKNFRPIKYLLMALGRFPLSCTKNEDCSRTYQWSWWNFNGIYFLFVTFMTFYILIIGSWNMFDILMDVSGRNAGDKDGQRDLKYEKVIVERHIGTFVVLWTSLIQCAIASVNFMVKRNHFAFYMSFWSKAVQNIHMDAAHGVYWTSLALSIGYVLILLIMVLLSVTRVGPSAISAPTLFGILMFREYVPSLYSAEWRNESIVITTKTTTTPDPSLVPDNSSFSSTEWKELVEIKEHESASRLFVTVAGGIFLVLMFAASKAYMFMFIYHCKLIRNAFANWNGRVYAGILMGGPEHQSFEGRTTFNLLFRDHCVLLDIMEATDVLYSSVLESFFGLQVCSICFEMYFFVRTTLFGTDRIKGADLIHGNFFIRPYDWAPGMLMFVQSIGFVVLVCLAAAEVGEEAMAGLEVLRRKSLMGRKTDDELYFMLSMFSSYTAYKRIELSGGGYFYLNKEFMIAVLSTIFSYFIILYQFAPKMDRRSNDPEERQMFGKFLTEFEGIGPKDHYVVSTTTVNP